MLCQNNFVLWKEINISTETYGWKMHIASKPITFKMSCLIIKKSVFQQRQTILSKDIEMQFNQWNTLIAVFIYGKQIAMHCT